MVFKPLGTAGIVGDQEWAKYVYSLAGQGKVAKKKGDLNITQVSGSRALNIGIGPVTDGNITVFNDSVATLNLPTPTAGQWFAIVLRVNWQTVTGSLPTTPPTDVKGVVTVRAEAHTTTSTTLPLTYPLTLPASILTNVGVEADIFLGWAWVNNTTTSVTFLQDYGYSASDKPYSFADATARDAYWAPPATFVQRLWLQNFLRNQLVYLENTGEYQSYYAEYSLANNPAGRTTAGWVAIAQPLLVSAWNVTYTGVPDGTAFSQFAATQNNTLTTNDGAVTYNQTTGLFTLPKGFWTVVVRLTNSTAITSQASVDIQDTTAARFWASQTQSVAVTSNTNFGTTGAGIIQTTGNIRVSFLKISGGTSNITGTIQFIRSPGGL